VSTKPTIFVVRLAEPPSISWIRRVFFGAVNPPGAVSALNNLYLKGARPNHEHIAAALRRYGVASADAQRAVLTQFCSDALARVLSWDAVHVADGRDEVARLAAGLGLSPRDVDEMQRRATGTHVRAAIKDVLKDRKFTPDERERVRAMGEVLGLDEAGIDALVRAEVEPLLTAAFESAIADRRYSPDEQAALEKFASDLGVKLKVGVREATAIGRFRLMWEIENGRLPEISAPITLQRKEVCHFTCEASWRELRTRTVRVNYHGPTARIRIMKGVYWRVGSIAPQRVTETNLVEVTRGTLYVTSKRVILDGTAGNKVVTWRSVFGQELFSDAIKLEKSSGKDPYLFLPPSEIEMASTVIAGAMAAAE
jgi:hypothetical protein